MAALDRVTRFYGLEPEQPRILTGHIDFSLDKRIKNGDRLLVGENAGFQDFLFGFGMRFAFLSGYLAARSIIENIDYKVLIEKELSSWLKSSLVNRYLFEKFGNRGYRILIRRLEKTSDIYRFMRNWYGWRPYKSLIMPFARRRLSGKAK